LPQKLGFAKSGRFCKIRQVLQIWLIGKIRQVLQNSAGWQNSARSAKFGRLAKFGRFHAVPQVWMRRHVRLA
jgi:hypothetical protein